MVAGRRVRWCYIFEVVFGNGAGGIYVSSRSARGNLKDLEPQLTGGIPMPAHKYTPSECLRLAAIYNAKAAKHCSVSSAKAATRDYLRSAATWLACTGTHTITLKLLIFREQIKVTITDHIVSRPHFNLVIFRHRSSLFQVWPSFRDHGRPFFQLFQFLGGPRNIFCNLS